MQRDFGCGPVQLPVPSAGEQFLHALGEFLVVAKVEPQVGCLPAKEDAAVVVAVIGGVPRDAGAVGAGDGEDSVECVVVAVFDGPER